MGTYNMTETENFLAELIWEKEPIRSGELVKMAVQRFGWRKSTTYTVLRKICGKGIFQNQAAVVTARISKEEYTGRKGEQYKQESQDSPQPKNAAAFSKSNKPGSNDIEELVTLIEENTRSDQCQ